MAQLNQDAAQPVSGGKNRVVTHYINVGVTKPDGTLVRLGAVPVYDGGDKAQRTLIDAVLGERKINPASFDVVIDVRANVKSTELDDISEWGTRTDGLVTQAE